MQGLELEIGRVAAGRQGQVQPAFAQGLQQLRDTRQGLGGGEMLALQLGVLADVFGARDGELGPGVEDLAGFGAGAALELGFDVPGEVGAVAFAQDDVVAEGVDVFGVEEETVHVEEAGPDGREAGAVLAVWFAQKQVMTGCCLLGFECCHCCRKLVLVLVLVLFFILLLTDRKLKDVSTTVVSFSKQQQQIPNLLRSDRTHGQSEVKDQGRAALGRMCCIHGG